jgi:hypothetical protein
MRFLTFALFAFWLHGAFASDTKYYVVPEEGGTGKNVIVGASGFVPKNVIVEAPLESPDKPYPIEVLDIVEEPSPISPNATRKVARVNATKLADKKAKDALDLSNQKAREAATAARRLRLKNLCTAQTGVIKEICDELNSSLGQ